MAEIRHDDWSFNVDIESTAQYYKDYDGLCSCAMCRNFYLNAQNLQYNIRGFLERFGIDVAKPIEQWSTSANKQENLVNNVLYYAVSGNIESWGKYEIDFGVINIVVQAPNPTDVVKCPENSPNTEIGEPYFIFEIFNVWLPWTVDDDINECYPDPKLKKSLFKKLFSKRNKPALD